MLERWFGWALLMVLTGLATVWLWGAIEPVIPPGDWHARLSVIFVVVTWPALTWSLRAFASHHLLDLFSAPWWW